MRLVWLIGDRQGAPRQARVWAQNAELLLSQSRQAPQFRLWLAVALARLDRLSGDPATGLTRVETALTEAAREPTVTAAERQSALREQAEAHLALGDYPAADSVARRALAEAKAIDAPHARFVRRAEQLLQRVQSEQ